MAIWQFLGGVSPPSGSTFASVMDGEDSCVEAV